jgi:tetratricopeptide (TPR) repeat protein
MKNASSPMAHALRQIFRLAALSAALTIPLAHADDYSDVNQLVRSGKLTEALTRADQYLATKPRDPQMRFLKGVVQTEAGKPNDAIGTFLKLTEDYPELPEPYNNLAVLYASQSQYDKARAALEMAIRTNPSYATAHENLGDVYAKLASQAYSKALQLDSNNTGVQPKLALIRDLFSPGAKGRAPDGPCPCPGDSSGRQWRQPRCPRPARRPPWPRHPPGRLRPPPLRLPRLRLLPLHHQVPRRTSRLPCWPGPLPGRPRT